MIGESRVRANLTSYEIVWATPRNAPSNEYFELDLHPAASKPYTFNPAQTKKNRTPSLNGVLPNIDGMQVHTNKARKNLVIGAKMKGI